jgi:hypothetical protein
MQKVRVFNDNVHPFTQKFQGEVITIPPKGFIEMDFHEANTFVHKPSPMKKTGTGDCPTGYKMLRIPVEDLRAARDSEAQKVTAYKSHVDGTLHASPEDVEKHERQFTARKAKDKDK